MSIQWFSKTEKSINAVLYKTSITLNKQAVTILNDYLYCQLGVDPDKKQIIIKPITKQEYDLHLVNDSLLFPLSISNSYVRISSSLFIHYIEKITHLDYNKEKIKYLCQYKENSNQIIIDLRKEI